jgi:hypothetical protein
MAIFNATHQKLNVAFKIVAIVRAQQAIVHNERTFLNTEAPKPGVPDFFLVQCTKTGEKYNKLPQIIQNIHKIYQMAEK